MMGLLTDPVVWRLFLSVALVVAVILLRMLLERLIRHGSVFVDEKQRRRMFLWRSLLNSALVLCIVGIWFDQIQDFALSLTAITVALVIATKELIMCVSGFLLRAGNGHFSVGDWVEIGDTRGEVIDHSLFVTTLLELTDTRHGEVHTGRTVVVPNSAFLTREVRNENFARNYAYHRFSVTMEHAVAAKDAQATLERIAKDACAGFAEVGLRYNTLIERKLGVDLPSPEPQVWLHTSDLGKMCFEVLLFCPSRQVLTLESQITATFLDQMALTHPTPQ